MRLKLHSTGCRKLEAIGGRLTEYRDQVVPGLVLRVTPSGYHGFSVRYRRGGRGASFRRISFGPVEKVGLAKARKLARDIYRQLAAGQDPAAERRRVAARSTLPRTVEELVNRCLSRLELRASTRKEWERVASAEIAPSLGKRLVEELNRAEIREWREGLLARSRHIANTAFKILRRAYSWALQQEMVTTSPCAGLGMPAPEVRNDRWLRPHELRALWKALGDVAQDSPYPDVVRMLLLTGLRRGEVLAAHREEFQELDGLERRWIVPAERMKGGLEHVVPLSRQAAEIVSRRLERVKGIYVFPALGADVPTRWPSAFVEMLRERMLELVREELEDPEAEVPRWTIHGIRHTVATHLQDSLKVPDDVVALILGHRPPGLSDADRIYLRGRKIEERRRALQRWADWLARIEAHGQQKKVVPLQA